MKPIATVGDADTPLSIETMVTAQQRMLTMGVDCDAMEYQLRDQQVMDIEAALIASKNDNGRFVMTFRGAPVVVRSHPESGCIICPSTPYNETSGSAGMRIAILSRGAP